MPPKGQITSRIAHYLGRAETVVLVLIAVVLIALALVLLGNASLQLGFSLLNGKVQESAFGIFDSVLLVLMTMEIVYTVTVLLETRKLVAEPL